MAVLITKALIEIPPKFAGKAPVNPDAQKDTGGEAVWKGASGLAADVRYYGRWMRDEAWKRIGHLYPKGPNGETIIAWLWARTVKCPNPACGAQMPLVRSFWLSTKKGKEAWVEPIVDRQAKTVRFEVLQGKGTPREATKQRAYIYCIVCEQSVSESDLRKQASHHGFGLLPLAKVLEGQRQRDYMDSSEADVPSVEAPEAGYLQAELPKNPRWFSPPAYGLSTYYDLFTPRQLVALTTFCDLVQEVRALVLEHSGGDDEYANAVVTYEGFALDRCADRWCSLAVWQTGGDKSRGAFARQALPMTWDFVEANPFCSSSGNWLDAVEFLTEALGRLPKASRPGYTYQLDTAVALPPVLGPLVFTDPPYYDNATTMLVMRIWQTSSTSGSDVASVKYIRISFPRY